MAKSTLNYHKAILLLIGSWLFILAEGEYKNLCADTNGNITDTGDTGDEEYKFMSVGCNSNPNALILKFVSRDGNCDRGRNSAKSTITVREKALSYHTCDMLSTDCYAFLMNVPISFIKKYRCNLVNALIVDEMPTVEFKYNMQQSSSSFTLFYEHIVENQETITTTTTTFETSSIVSDISTDFTTDATTDVPTDVTTDIALESKQTPCTSPVPTSQTNSREKIIILVLGILLIIILLILGIVAIRYHRVKTSLKSASPTGPEGTGSTSNSGEVVVNQIYDSVRDKKSGGEVVVNELYEMT